MNKKIEFDYDNKHYTLEYNRAAIAFIEKQGFSISELSDKPMVMLPLAFTGLFFKNHKTANQKTIDEIYGKFTNKELLIQTIADMLTEAYDSLQAEPEDTVGNIEWKIV